MSSNVKKSNLSSSIVAILCSALMKYRFLNCKKNDKAKKFIFTAYDGKHSHFSFDISMLDYTTELLTSLNSLVGKFNFLQFSNVIDVNH